MSPLYGSGAALFLPHLTPHPLARVVPGHRVGLWRLHPLVNPSLSLCCCHILLRERSQKSVVAKYGCRGNTVANDDVVREVPVIQIFVLRFTCGEVKGQETKGVVGVALPMRDDRTPKPTNCTSGSGVEGARPCNHGNFRSENLHRINQQSKDFFKQLLKAHLVLPNRAKSPPFRMGPLNGLENNDL